VYVSTSSGMKTDPNFSNVLIFLATPPAATTLTREAEEAEWYSIWRHNL